MYVRNSVPSLCAASTPSAVAPSLRAGNENKIYHSAIVVYMYNIGSTRSYKT